MFTATLSLPASLGALGRLYPWLEQAARDARVPPAITSRMHVAAEEAATNAVRHGVPPGSDAVITLTLIREEALVRLVLEDPGMAFDPLDAGLPEHEHSLAAVTPGGWGLNLIRKFCPRPGYQRLDGVNRLTLAYPIAE